MAKVVAGVATAVGAAALMVVNPAAGSLLATKIGGVTLAQAAGQAGLSIGASLTLGGIADELRGGAGYSGSVRQPAGARQVIYGQCRVAGTVIYTNTTGHQLNQVIAWCSHPVQSIDNIYLDGRKIYGLTNGYGNADGQKHWDYSGVEYKFESGKVWCESSYGTPEGKWLSTLWGQNHSFWGSDCLLQGICATYVKTTQSDSQFSGIPQVKSTITGKSNIYDPRTETYGYTNNAALCIADFLTNSDYGVGCTWAEIDIDQLIAAANICDELVPLAAGGTEKRYTVNGFFDYSATPGDTLLSMLMAMEGHIAYTGGKFQIFPAAWYGTNLEFTDNDVIGEIKWTASRKNRDLCNAVRATYISPVYPYEVVGADKDTRLDGIFDGQWQPCDAPEYAQDVDHGYASDDNLTADGCKLFHDRRYQFVTSAATVQRLMKIYLMRNRQQGSGSFKMNLSAYQTQAQDVIQMTLPELGWTNKYLEVQNFRFVPSMGSDSEAPSLHCEIDVVETSPAVYSWSTAEERTPTDGPSPQIANLGIVPAPTGLTLTSDSTTAVVGLDGVTTPRILASWDAITDPFVDSGGGVTVQYQKSGDSTWKEAAYVTSSLNSCYISNVVSGQTYNVRIRAVRGNGAYSDWTVCEGHTVATVRSVLSAADVYLTDTQSLQNAISNISSDNVLTSGEKSTIITDVANIQAEKDGIDALAEFYGVTTERAAYDTAVSDLNSYLATLTTPVAWNNTTGNTNINGSTFRSKFEAVYSARTALANKASTTAKQLADTAKSTADSAKQTADNAQDTANNAQNTADDAKNTANNAQATASAAQVLANSALGKVTVVNSMPAASGYSGRFVFLTTASGSYQPGLYYSEGSTWSREKITASMLVDQITAGQIAAGAVTADAIASNSITASKISFNAGDVKYTSGQSIDSLKPAQAGADVTANQPIAYTGMDENLVSNGSFRFGTQDWSVVEGSGTFSVLDDPYAKSLYLSNSGGIRAAGSRPFKVIPGRKYHVRADIWVGGGTTSARGLYFRINYRKDYADLITAWNRDGCADGVGGGDGSIPAGTWTRKEWDWTCPANIYWASLAFYNWSDGDWDIYVADAQVIPYGAAAQWGADVTSSNTAAAIANQGALATRSDVVLGSHLRTSGGTMLGDVDVVTAWGTAGDVQTGDGKAVRQRGADVTGWNTAAAIANQGTLATRNNITSTELTAGCVQTPHLDTNGISVGGGGGKPGTIAVYNASGQVIGYIGGSAAGSYGGWFQTLGIGGSGVNSPNLYADSSGNIFMRGQVYGSSGVAVDTNGNLKLKNKAVVYGSTYGPWTGDEYYTVVPEMRITVNVASAGNGVMILFSGQLDVPNRANDCSLQACVYRDGYKVSPDYGGWIRAQGCAGMTVTFIDTTLTGLTAGQHTYEIYGLSTQGTGTPARWMGTSRTMTLVELG